jgi:methyl-accepting chemotaxis protein
MAVRLTLGKKIASGIVFMLILMIVVGVVAYHGLSGLLGVTNFSMEVLRLDNALTSAESDVNRYVASTYSGDKELEAVAVKEGMQKLSEAAEFIQKIKGWSGLLGIGVERFEQAGKALDDFTGVFANFRKLDEEKSKLEKTMEQNSVAMLDKMAQGVLKKEEMILGANVLRTAVVNYVKRPNADSWTIVDAGIVKLDKAISEWAEVIQGSDQLKALSGAIKKDFEEYRAAAKSFNSMAISQQELKKNMEAHVRTLEKICNEFVELSTVRMNKQTRTSLVLIFGCIGFAVLIGTAYAGLSIRSIVHKLKTVIAGVTNGSEQVVAAADEIAVASQSLADGSSENASSLEETSSSLEEMSSLTRQNAERAREAKGLMGDVQQIVGNVNRHMEEMAGAVSQISASSMETAKIIRTIDEIAFQTNLLALNAAVEAARAGETGAGFAVVADEVRNLAMRAAEASKNTTSLIENTVQNVKKGDHLTLATQEAFKENVLITGKVGQLVDEIAEASSEQALGIEQVNRAVSEMNGLLVSSSLNETQYQFLTQQGFIRSDPSIFMAKFFALAVACNRLRQKP